MGVKLAMAWKLWVCTEYGYYYTVIMYYVVGGGGTSHVFVRPVCCGMSASRRAEAGEKPRRPSFLFRSRRWPDKRAFSGCRVEQMCGRVGLERRHPAGLVSVVRIPRRRIPSSRVRGHSSAGFPVPVPVPSGPVAQLCGKISSLLDLVQNALPLLTSQSNPPTR